MSNRLGGKQGTAYLGTNANQPPNITFNNRPPNQYDTQNVSVGDFWLDNSDDGVKKLWWLASLAGDMNSKGPLAEWVQFGSGDGNLETLTGNSGGPVGPDVNNNINVVGTGVISVVGTPVNNTLTITPSGAIASSFPTDAGTAIPLNGVTNVFGAGGITTSAVGNTITITGPAQSGGLVITTFTADGTWNKNANSKFMQVFGWNGGGGGGAGSNDTANSGGGGAGGAGGGGFYFEGPAIFFPASAAVVIGQGGAGGIGGPEFAPANPGQPGGQTFFGNMTQAPNGGGGGGGVNSGAQAAGGTAQPSAQQYSTVVAAATGGGVGGGGGAAGPAVPTAIAFGSATFSGKNYIISGLGGGGGSGQNTSNAQQAAAGQSATNYNGSVTFIAGGAGGIATGTKAGSPGNNYTMVSGYIIGGSGGGGGGGTVGTGGLTDIGGVGGAGGIPGGGGGGGGGSSSDTGAGGINAANGGAGGRGEVWVIEYL